MEISSERIVIAPAIRGNQLLLPENTDGLTLADYVPVLETYREINANLVFDYRDKKGNAEARSHVAKLRKVKAPIADIHKRLKAEYKAIVDKMDADKREALSIVEDMIEFHDQHLREVAAEHAAEEQRLKIEQEISDCWDMAHEMNAIVDQQREIDRKAAEQALIAEKQAAEQRRLQIEQEKKEAAEKAAEEARLAERARAEQKVKEAQEAARKAEMEAQEKAARAIAEAEAAAQRKAEEQAEAERQQRAAQEKAKADDDNARRVHWAIIPALIAASGCTEDQAKGIILAIRGGAVPAVSIDYQWQLGPSCGSTVSSFRREI